MNNLFTRVSIRKYQPKPVEPDKLEAILRAAMQAPSAANQQPWEFYVVTNDFSGVKTPPFRRSGNRESGRWKP